MNLDEETFLTAYLDGELPVDLRLGVDSVLMTDPVLGEHLRALSAVRDLVQGLPRTSSPVDVSAAVVARIDARQQGSRLRLTCEFTAGSWTSRVAALVTAAAAVLAATNLIPLEPSGSFSPKVTTVVPPGVVSDTPGATPESAPDRVAEKTPTQVVQADPAPGPNERRRDVEQTRIRRMLDSPSLRKILILTDTGEADAGRKVGDILEKTPRQQSSFVRITVTQGIFLDPERPGEAVVYALVMDDRELKDLQAAIQVSFPSGLDEQEPRPEMVTQLTDVGQFSVHAGTPVAGLLAFADEPKRAIRAQDPDPLLNIRNPAQDSHPHPPVEPPVTPAVPDAVHDSSAPVPSLRTGHRSHPSDAHGDDLFSDLRPRPGASVVLLLVRTDRLESASGGTRD